VLAAFASWIGLRIAQRKPTEKFPYGYYKAETIVALFIGIFILYMGFSILVESYQKITAPSRLEYPIFALIVSLASAIVSLLISYYEGKVGREIASQSLVTLSQESRLDVLTSLIVFVGILSSSFGYESVDALVGMLVSIIVIKNGIKSTYTSLISLMDISPSKEIEEKIKKMIQEMKEIKGYENLKLRQSGPFIFGEVTIKVEKQANVEKAHEIADKLERKIKENNERIDTFTIHIEPYESPVQKVAMPIENKRGLHSSISRIFGRAPYFLFAKVDKRSRKIFDVKIKANPFMEEMVRAGLSTSDWLLKEKIDALLTKEIGDISFHKLKANLIGIYRAEGDDVKAVLEKFIKGNLLPLTEPTKKEPVVRERGYGYRRRRGPWWRRWW